MDPSFIERINSQQSRFIFVTRDMRDMLPASASDNHNQSRSDVFRSPLLPDPFSGQTMNALMLSSWSTKRSSLGQAMMQPQPDVPALAARFLQAAVTLNEKFGILLMMLAARTTKDMGKT